MIRAVDRRVVQRQADLKAWVNKTVAAIAADSGRLARALQLDADGG